MNIITKSPITSLGYNFIAKKYIPKGKDEYYLRNKQHRSRTNYRKLTDTEIKILTKNGNSSDNWNNIHVAEVFDTTLIKNCSFYGLVRIGKMEPCFLEFNNLRMPVGLYNSVIVSADIGDNVVINNVNFMSHYIVGNDVMLVNINELATTDHSKFGNGIVKKGEKESVRVWIEICNENAARSILAFNGIQAGDAWLWSKYRDDEKLLQKLKEFTDKEFDTQRGYYGKIGDRTVIKNTRIIKDTWIGSDAYIKGANKLKNLTINSSAEAKSQIGEGCELVNGIIGFGCRIFYGVKAVRFILGSNSQLKYGARLINSYLGDNSTISCCEVLNSLIFPAHEQHHNNSFLCAATVLGQSNMAAGATIGSNHNSRGADGEIIAGRGFWPGLCVSLKHNSKFASFTIIAKGDFPAELNIPIPFSLISNEVATNKLIVMPGYWFLYNMYALIRNARKYEARDKRTDKTQALEYNFLAPDSVNEIFSSLKLMEESAMKAWQKKYKKNIPVKELFSQPALLSKLEITVTGFENSNRKVELVKVAEAHSIFKELITYYGISEIIRHIENKKIVSWKKLVESLPAKTERSSWKNMGGQLMPESNVQTLVRSIRSGKINAWDAVHDFYAKKSSRYVFDKLAHAVASLFEIQGLNRKKFSKKIFIQLLHQNIATRKWITQSICATREKDYNNPFRQMVYDTQEEMEKVLGKLKDNSFIVQQQEETIAFEKKVMQLISQLE